MIIPHTKKTYAGLYDYLAQNPADYFILMNVTGEEIDTPMTKESVQAIINQYNDETSLITDLLEQSNNEVIIEFSESHPPEFSLYFIGGGEVYPAHSSEIEGMVCYYCKKIIDNIRDSYNAISEFEETNPDQFEDFVIAAEHDKMNASDAEINGLALNVCLECIHTKFFPQ